jgi:hypothetical protein
MAGEETQSKSRTAGARNLLSTLLFVLAAALVAVAAYLFIQDWREDDDPPPPPAIAGKAELANVHDAFASEGLDVEYGDDNVRANAFDPAGQQLIVDGESIFIFIFPNPGAREAATEDLDAGELELTYPFGDPVTEEPLSIGQGSNVVAVLVGADQDLQASIDAALSTLP